jgi:hypothetical protein
MNNECPSYSHSHVLSGASYSLESIRRLGGTQISSKKPSVTARHANDPNTDEKAAISCCFHAL